ncbi:MAG: response regulator [Hydrogenophaga sp.]|uniref:hybrid sensor histidine kinase/response regulator n=1 Tax=Hydrogenophaga sp. TaxID=1904254 RepID=UPI0016A92421|nr:hybrid sensor histidine kinase/response regulator [Hydrogenophaga sp.]NIM41611.1 response regulator [Hydrogenophaga sp.]NIN26919.1 response regulator [Hydrogenophaga sp.]NIN31620.1 response regulator [Hydrogenophaga sp.]NIN55854.1 response regulator [Hydrogenophaga sp.]NIO51653.1 response regulator [Hydrogenophaga sp.]
MRTDAQAILFVDDEAVSRQWFSRCFGDEFEIATAASVEDALTILADRGESFAALITDYRMPEQDGMKLLKVVRREHRYLVRLLVTAYAEKDVAIAAVNQGQVLRILEKPLEDEPTREALREALSLYRHQAMERALNEGRAAALRESLGFLAHELNTPLATVRGSVAAVLERHRPPEPGDPPGTVRFEGLGPKELLAALERAERRALYCQSLVATFVQSARDAYPGAAPQTVSASGLLGALLDEYPFEDRERRWVEAELRHDFRLPGRRDLLYLVMCTLTKNAILALRETPSPRLHVAVDSVAGPGQPRGFIRFIDNGPGIAPDVLARLTREPVTTRAASGGNGMGLMFCQRVMQAAGGQIRVKSILGEGTTVELMFERGVQPVDAVA